MKTATVNSNVTELRGVGKAKAEALAKIGIFTVRDLLYRFPRAYQNRGDTKSVADAAQISRTNPSPPPVSLILTVSSDAQTAMIRKNMTLLKFRAFDDTGVVEITYFNQPFLKSQFRTGAVFRFWGRVKIDRGRVTLASPVAEPYLGRDCLAPIVPVYPLTSGISQKMMSSLVGEALKISIPESFDHIPHDVLRNSSLCSLTYALRNIHFPTDTEALSMSQRRLAFDEIYTVSVAMKAAKRDRIKHGAPVFKNTDLSEFLHALPYELTGVQKRAIGDIVSDTSSDAPMSRILCGDVGSGKTAVAAAGVYLAAKNGFRSALMAPTEILAKQHYQDLSELFAPLGIKTALLCGSLPASVKKKVRASLSSTDRSERPDLVIGTHALLTSDAVYEDFGLIITDEQHRFGVNQRAELKNKNTFAHCLGMSATPIPRTLSLVMYGDLDVSVLGEMPPGRKKVSTFRIDENYRERLLGFIRKQKEEGHRTYIVCPAIEESEKSTEEAEEMCDIIPGLSAGDAPEPPLKAAVQYAAELKEKLPGVNVGFIHGKMKTNEKDRVMEAFVGGKLDVLVSTTVIEVGVNVPEATLMIVENAEHFGLSQLHQLRGRVGRGNAKSYCILVSDSKSAKSAERLGIMCESNDGFEIAEKDLKMRGPGAFFAENGTYRQHGDSDMHFSSLCTDEELISSAVRAAEMTVSDDPSLEKDKNKRLSEKIEEMRKSAENSVS